MEGEFTYLKRVFVNLACCSLWFKAVVVGVEGMPTGWRGPGDGEYERFKPARYDILEINGYDDKGDRQGTILVGVLKRAEEVKHGRSFEGMYLGASDEYYRYWATEGGGASLCERATYHLCEDSVRTCTQWPKRATVIHTDRFRHVVSSEVRDGRISWLRSKEIRDPIVLRLEQFEVLVRGRVSAGGPLGPYGRPPEADAADDSEDEGSSDSDSAQVRSRLKKLKAELRDAQKKLDKKSKTKGKKRREAGPSRGRRSSGDKKPRDRRRAGRSPSQEEKSSREPSRTKRKKKEKAITPEEEKRPLKKRREERSGSSTEGSPGESGDGGLFRSAKPAKVAAKKAGADRGPFGGGPPLHYNKGDEDSDSDSDSGFRDAPARSANQSGQQRLTRYSQKYPGRLASRLLIKMREASARDLVGANNEDTVTPPLASHFLLTVLIPALGQKASLRTQRELRTLGKGLDLLARGETGQCADLLGQRIKALDRASQEGQWTSAQFLELLPPDGVTLLEWDEEMFLRQEFLLERKAKLYEKPQYTPRPPKGEGKGDKSQKGKGGGKEPRAKPMVSKTAEEGKK